MRARLAAVTTGVAAVGSKELRGRMRGPRAFLALTFYLALLAGFTVMVYLLAAQSAASQAAFGGGNDGECDPHVIDVFAGMAKGDKSEIDEQKKMLTFECADDGTSKAMATLTMVKAN